MLKSEGFRTKSHKDINITSKIKIGDKSFLNFGDNRIKSKPKAAKTDREKSITDISLVG